jgi:hypothetical protein
VTVSGCTSEYPIAPTACDDWCFATQRASCEDDYPEECVSECEESAIGRRVPACESPWLALITCYRAAPRDQFRCIDDRSRPGSTCIEERASLAECAAPSTGRCVERCLQQTFVCDEWTRDCESECPPPPAGCEAQNRALYDCRAQTAPACGEAIEEQDARCLDQALELLACANYPSGADDPSEALR